MDSDSGTYDAEKKGAITHGENVSAELYDPDAGCSDAERAARVRENEMVLLTN